MREVDPSGAVTLACSKFQEGVGTRRSVWNVLPLTTRLQAYYRSNDIVVSPTEIFEKLVEDDHVPIHLILSLHDEYR